MKKYTLGLDIGTNSVGYAVMEDNYKVPAKKMKVLGNTDKKTIKKNLLGTFLFSEGQTAADRRLKRGSRRRYTRRKNRVRYLQEIFDPEIAKVDPNFFQRLSESGLTPDDKKFNRHPIFGTRDEEQAYHQKYKTIYHLRSELANKDEKADLRLVYMALAHIIKYRGNFLIEGKLDFSALDAGETFKEFCELFDGADFEEKINFNETLTSKVNEIFKDKKLSKSKKADELLKLTGVKRNQTAHQFFKLMAGNIGNFKKVFSLDEDTKLAFTTEAYDEDLDKLLGKIGDGYLDVFTYAKKVYDAIVLSSTLHGQKQETNTPFSDSMIARYDDHAKDLAGLKQLMKKYVPEKCSEFFSDPASKMNGYASYIDGKASEEDFYKAVRKLLKDVPGSEKILQKIEMGDYLRKQRTFDNGVIPHQVQLKELEAIIDNQSKYYPFLAENKDKFVKILKFKIPYYVGPLAREGGSPFAWVKRKKEGKITPYNFDEMIDKHESAQRFIERMTVNDIYLPTEKVLPKHSLLYEKFLIFNELSRVRYVTENSKFGFLDAETRRKVFELFKEKRNVRVTDVIKFFNEEIPELGVVDIKGVDNGKFNTNYGTYHDLLKIGVSKEILADEANSEKLEDIIKTLTIFEDRELIKSRLQKYEDFLGPKVIKKLSRKKYTGWAKRSAKLIDGIYDKRTHKTILDCLMYNDFSQNFMQLINSDDYSFKKIIEDAQIVKDNVDLPELVQELPGSPAIKKAILQSLEIVDEVVKVMGNAPEYIVVEMARETQNTSRTTNRYKKLEEITKALDSDILESVPNNAEVDSKGKLVNSALNNERLYLYYLQNGKDMYTGEALDIDHLQDYEVDHIIPQSFLKDDSLDNKVLTSKRENSRKTNGCPSEEIVKNMGGFWRKLLDAKAISPRKYSRLRQSLNGGLTDKVKEGFIKRQLVETRQITKYVAQILDDRFNADGENNVKIVTLKAQLTAQFRKDFELYKVRNLNNLHHAHDAYLNAVIARLLIEKYPELTPEFVYGQYLAKGYRNNKATTRNIFYSNVLNFLREDDVECQSFWDKKRDLATIKKVLYRSQVNVVHKVERQKGQFYKENLVKKGTNMLPKKNGLDTQKYGGYKEIKEEAAILVWANKGRSKKMTKEMVRLPIIEAQEYRKNPNEYLAKKGYKAISENEIILPRYSLLENKAGYRRYITSSQELLAANELVLPENLTRFLYYTGRLDKNDRARSVDYIQKHAEDNAKIFDYYREFMEKTIRHVRNDKVYEIYEKNVEADPVLMAKELYTLLRYLASGPMQEFEFFGEKVARRRYTNSKKEWENATLIYSSKTGLYETRIDLGSL